jgi:secreted trypsin-like serine protease
MNPVTNPPVIVQPIEKSSSTKWIICAAVCIVLVATVVFVGVGLGVGLGIGLRKKSTSASSSENIILSAPIVNCTYINSSTCGCAATQPTFLSSRIVSGYTAVAHSWPWAVALYYNNALLCEGFLVTYEHVITAAHCASSLTMTSLQIYAGIDSRSSSIDKQIRNISNIEIHPNYSSTDFLNDIAILKLASPLNTTTTVGICCLPSDLSLPIQGEHAVIVGWGRTRESETSSLSDTLQQALVQIQQCNTNSNSDRQFCAAYGRSDSCQGDSGGPLMTNVNNLWTCTGIVSYGIGCGNGGYYTRVSYYRLFIDNVIRTM